MTTVFSEKNECMEEKRQTFTDDNQNLPNFQQMFPKNLLLLYNHDF